MANLLKRPFATLHSVTHRLRLVRPFSSSITSFQDKVHGQPTNIRTPEQQRAFLDAAGADPLVKQVVNNIMRDGKKIQAEKLVAQSLSLLQERTNQNPLMLLNQAVDAASPYVKIVNLYKGSRRVLTPMPLSEKGRRRQAIVWIRDAAAKRRASFPVRFATEIIGVLNGKSGALDKKLETHKLALDNRSAVVVRERPIRK